MSEQEVSSNPTSNPSGNAVEIDLKVGWSEWGMQYQRFAESGERKVVKLLKNDLARCCASAQALRALHPLLTEEQRTIVSKALCAELSKWGY